MDAWFPSTRRRTARFDHTAVDHAALLSRTAALQAATPTARAQTRVELVPDAPEDPHVAVFADAASRADADLPASFADVEATIFRPRQPK